MKTYLNDESRFLKPKVNSTLTKMVNAIYMLGQGRKLVKGLIIEKQQNWKGNHPP
jgi:hypothetical protein